MEKPEGKSITSLLLPREKWAEISKAWGRLPHFEIEKEGQVLYYFGANHSPNLDDPQYPALKKYWENFLETTEGRDRIVLIEIGLRKLFKNEKEAIFHDVESGLITFLAHEANIPVASPDVSGDDIMGQLPDIPKEQVLLYEFLVQVNHWQSYNNPKPNFEQSAESWCENQKSRKIWQGIDVSLEHLKRIYEEVLGKDFNENDDVNAMVNPNITETRINEIVRLRADIRDANIVSEIARYWKEGKSIFVVFGSGHLIIEEPALKTLLE